MSRRAFLERLISPGYGTCCCCSRPWRFVEPHVVNYGAHGIGAFALCERCWSASGQLYRFAAMYRAHGDDDEEWPLIESALRDGAIA